MQLAPRRAKIRFRAVIGTDAAMDQDSGDGFGDVDLPGEAGYRIRIRRINHRPPVLSNSRVHTVSTKERLYPRADRCLAAATDR